MGKTMLGIYIIPCPNLLMKIHNATLMDNRINWHFRVFWGRDIDPNFQ